MNPANKTIILSSITSAKPKDRIDHFKNIKCPHLETGHPLSITYDKTSFLDFLDYIQTPGNGITGVRVYFASNPDNTCGKKNCLTLIFSPTVDTELSLGYRTDLADSGDYYISNIQANIATIVKDNTTAKAMINEFRKQGGVYNTLSSHLLDKRETRSLWFCKENIKTTHAGISVHPTTYIIANFAAYLDSVSNDSETVNVGKYNNSSSITVSPFNHLALFFSTDDAKEVYGLNEYFDTGAPCPPNEGCTGSSI